MSDEDTVSHDEAIGQFCNVTGADENRAKDLLEACDWNLELAINMHVDTDDNHVSSINNSNNTSNHVRPPIPPVRQVLVSSPTPNTRASNSATGGGIGSSGVYDAFRDFEAEAQWQEMAQEGGSSSNSDGNAAPSSGSSNKRPSKSTLQDLFRPPLDIMFHGTFELARELGSTQNKWLLVNIQNAKVFNCQTLNRDVWSSEFVKDILKENFIFWQVYHDGHEGSRYIQFYNVFEFPHVAIIDPRTGEQVKSLPLPIDQNSFCENIMQFLSDHGDKEQPQPKSKLQRKQQEQELDQLQHQPQKPQQEVEQGVEQDEPSQPELQEPKLTPAQRAAAAAEARIAAMKGGRNDTT